MATVRILKSTTAGNVPSSLVSGQIAINESDGKLFYRNAAGVVTPLGATLASHAAQHAAGGSDPITISASQVTGLSAGGDSFHPFLLGGM